MSDDPLRDNLKTRAELDALPQEVCPRCGVVHRGFSREDLDAIIKQSAQNLSDAWDAECAQRVYGDYHR